MPLDPTEAQLLADLRDRSMDSLPRQVYADWLEERGRSAEAELLRLQLELRESPPPADAFAAKSARLRELAQRVDPTWRMAVALAPIERCDVRFDFVCPKRWEALEPTPLDDVRYCSTCRSEVFYAASVDDAYHLAQQGRCVVVDLVPLRRPGDLAPPLGPPPSFIPMAGAMAPPPPPKK